MVVKLKTGRETERMVFLKEWEQKEEEGLLIVEGKKEEKNWPFKMLAKQFSLVNKKTIERIIKKGKKINNPLFFVKYMNSNEGLKIAIAINAKKIPKAVERNKIKRRIKEVINKEIKKKEEVKKEIILSINKEIEKTTYVKIEKEIEKLFNILRKDG